MFVCSFRQIRRNVIVGIGFWIQSLFEVFCDFSGRSPNVVRECDYRIFVFSVDGIFRDDNISVILKIDVGEEVKNLLRSKWSTAEVKIRVIRIGDEKTIGGSVGKSHDILLC
jgi:hypothetical protein